MNPFFARIAAVIQHGLRSHSRSGGYWMAAVMAVMQGLYALQSFMDPAALAAYRGIPLEQVAWVHTYGSRTLFVALVVLLLLVRGEIATLKWITLIGLVMPLSDALTAIHAQAPNHIVMRHVATGIYLLVAFLLLARWTANGDQRSLR